MAPMACANGHICGVSGERGVDAPEDRRGFGGNAAGGWQCRCGVRARVSP